MAKWFNLIVASIFIPMAFLCGNQVLSFVWGASGIFCFGVAIFGALQDAKLK